MTAEEYFGDWMKVIDKRALLDVINKLQKIAPSLLCPPMYKVFRAFELCPYDECKVVFTGQDPYPQKGVAQGILFGNKSDTPSDKLSPSLEIIKESVIDYTIPHGPIEFDITLESWAKQGILMLNSALTCEVNKVGSHVNIWRPFIAKLLRNLSYRESGMIYVLFGKQAQSFKPYIDETKNIVIEENHPAYYARTDSRMPDTVFTEINRLLKEKYNTNIVWYKDV